MEDGKLNTFSSGSNSNSVGDVSFVQFNGFNLADNKYYLVIYDGKDKQLRELSIPIN